MHGKWQESPFWLSELREIFWSMRFVNKDFEKKEPNAKQKIQLTLISTANQFPPIRSVAKTPFFLSRLIPPFSLRSSGRAES